VAGELMALAPEKLDCVTVDLQLGMCLARRVRRLRHAVLFIGEQYSEQHARRAGRMNG
jgi:hypothetical protein